MKQFFTPLDRKQADTYSPLALAFVGDAVYEEFIRTKVLLLANTSANKLHKKAVAFVKASAQSKAMQALLPHLSSEEEAVFKRGRNANSGSVPKNADVTEYRAATGFEALMGYLFLIGEKDRLFELMEMSYSVLTDSIL